MPREKNLSAVRNVKRANAEASRAVAAMVKSRSKDGQRYADSFQNFMINLGIGTDNAMSGSTYGFNPVTKVRVLLEWIHRGSWIGGVAVDLVADDMTRAGIEVVSELLPESQKKLESAAMRTGTWSGLKDTVAWSRLYGGAVGYIMIDGQNPSTPLRPETIGAKQYKGILALDRWQVTPSLENLITELGPDIGQPKFYKIEDNAPALRGMSIHHSRVIRMEGVRLPYQQRLNENLWGLSVLERIYDRMVSYDSASTGLAQLMHKMYLRTLKLKNLREAVVAGGNALAGVTHQVDMMRRYQSQEGVNVIDMEDDFQLDTVSSLAGASDALMQFGMQLSGALQIPLVRLFGQSPSGLNSTGESDLRTYYDGILAQQNRSLKVGVGTVFQVMARSEGIVIGDDFDYKFKSLWQLSEPERATVAKTIVEAVDAAVNVGIKRSTALKELKDSSRDTGIFSGITDEEIKEADLLPPAPLGGEGENFFGEGSAPGVLSKPPSPGISGAPTNNLPAKIGDQGIIFDVSGIPIHIENVRGSVRRARDNSWAVVMPAHYGYIEGVGSAEGAFENLDCFVGRDVDSGRVWIIDQVDPDTRRFDEHKVMLGYANERDAIGDYVDAYHERGPERIGAVKRFSVDEFKTWMRDPENLTRGSKLRAVR